MDLIFWRHAEAEDEGPDGDDMQRSLTPRGEKQATRMAAWLDRQLPGGTRIVCSPARRCEQTVLTLGRKYKVRAELAPGAMPEELLTLAQWPDGKMTVLVVGHQPMLGQTIAQLMGMQSSDCSVKKGAVWWLRSRDREGAGQTLLVMAQSPETL
ncbi:MAG: histidine phosphatase family protein [Bdellovibrionales bacterium]|nr:histidine phosphatase family protein [Ramlibacter sp.]